MIAEFIQDIEELTINEMFCFQCALIKNNRG